MTISHTVSTEPMDKLLASVHADCPASFAQAFVVTYLREQVPAGNAFALRLRLPSGKVGLPGFVDLERTVSLTYETGDKAPHDGILLAWKPESGGPFPKFSGELFAEPDEANAAACTLRLFGRYTPPGGLAGRAFDAAFGTRIAQATLEEFLERLRDAAQTDFARRRNDGSHW